MALEKVALVTAGGSGMGAAAARRLAADGFRVAILSSSGKGEALAAAERWAETIAKNSPMSIRASKHAIQKGLEV